MKRLFFFALTMVSVLTLGACQAQSETSPQSLLEAALDRAGVDSGPVGVLVYVDGPGLRDPFSDARAGGDNVPIDPESTLRIASNTKTFTAAAVLRLVELNQLTLETPVSAVLTDQIQSILINGGYDVDAIRVRHLLTHTSGIPDHAQLDVYLQTVFAEPDRVWTADDQVALAMSDGEKIGEPGDAFSYSDTGYVLLGMILEALTDQDLSDAVRDLTGYDTLGLTATWWELRDPKPAGAPARLNQQAFGRTVASLHASIDLNGGGGLVSNLPDLARFHKAAAKGEIFDDASFSEMMTTPTAQSQEVQSSGYGMGFFVRSIAGETCLEHSGFWGTLAVYCPQSDVVVSAAVTDPQAFRVLFPLVAASIEVARGS